MHAVRARRWPPGATSLPSQPEIEQICFETLPRERIHPCRSSKTLQRVITRPRPKAAVVRGGDKGCPGRMSTELSQRITLPIPPRFLVPHPSHRPFSAIKSTVVSGPQNPRQDYLPFTTPLKVATLKA